MEINVVVPAFNEAARWDRRYWAEFVQMPESNWLFVDDGSQDETNSLLTEFASSYENVRVLALPTNRGKGEAVRAGLVKLLEEESASCVAFMDADGAFSVNDLSRLQVVFAEQVLGGAFDSVWSSRVALAGRDIRRSTRRHYLGRIVSTALSLGLGEIPYDTQSGLKLFLPTPELAKCLDNPFVSRWLFDVEIMTRWKRITGQPLAILEEPLLSWHDVPGSKVKGREAIRAAAEVYAVIRDARSDMAGTCDTR